MDIGAGILAGGQGIAGGLNKLGDLLRDEREKAAFRELLQQSGLAPAQMQQTAPLAQMGQQQTPAGLGQPQTQNPGNATTSQIAPQIAPENRAMSQGFANEFGNKWAQQPGAIGGAVPSLAGVAAPQMRGQQPQQYAQAPQRSMNGALPQSLYGSESGGNYRAQNNVVGAGGQVGHFGRAQFGQARLAEAAAAGAIPQGTTPQAFMSSPELQQRAEAWHVQDINQFIARNGLDQAIGKQINGVTITLPGMQAVAHLGGNAGLKRFIETGGQYNPADANGTSLMAYLAQHGGGQAQTNPLAGVQPMSDGSNAKTPYPQAQQPQTLAQLSQPQGQPQFDMQTLGALMTNKYGAPLAQQILAKQLGRDPMQAALMQEQLRAAQLGNQRTQAELSGEGAKLQQIDMGDSIGFVNQRGELVRSIQKNISQKPVIVPEGATLANPVTGQAVMAGTPKPGEFQKSLDKKNADMFSSLLDQGAQVQSDIADIGRLRGLLPNTPSGLQAKAARLGNTIGIGSAVGANVQEFDAIVNRLVPAQRPAGSGTMSDRDVELFKSSLPNLSGTPEGNKRIIDTMEGMARYKQSQVEIANRVATGQISPTDGIKALGNIPNPLAWIREQNKSANDATVTPNPKQTTVPKPGELQDGYRFKGGNPADPNSWVKAK